MLSAADDLTTAAHDRHRVSCRRLWSKQNFLGDPASLGQHTVLSRVQPSGTGQAALDELGQGQIHVVAAEQKVLADCLADEAEFSLLLDGSDQAEITGATAHIDYETARARLELPGFRRRVQR